MPTTTRSPPADSRPIQVGLSVKTLFRWGRREAISRAASMPRNFARPPSRGVGIAWTSRSRTGVMALNQMANFSTRGTRRYVTIAPVRNVRMYSLTLHLPATRARYEPGTNAIAPGPPAARSRTYHGVRPRHHDYVMSRVPPQLS